MTIHHSEYSEVFNTHKHGGWESDCQSRSKGLPHETEPTMWTVVWSRIAERAADDAHEADTIASVAV
jgi:hypothetical protein